jgi:hypothetical protein
VLVSSLYVPSSAKECLRPEFRASEEGEDGRAVDTTGRVGQGLKVPGK